MNRLNGLSIATIIVPALALGLIGGALGDTDFMWDAYAGLGYNFTDHFSASAGWRGMGFDYEDGGTVLDLTFHGPIAGLTLRF